MVPAGPSVELKRLAHDVKNALNGAAVNLEVARTRATRGISDPAQLVPYLDNAAQQLDAAAKLHKQFADLAAGFVAERDAGERHA